MNVRKERMEEREKETHSHNIIDFWEDFFEEIECALETVDFFVFFTYAIL